jgi:vacuolar-type H+-ATPase subunit I/STV1
MSEDLTQKLSQTFEERIFARLDVLEANFNARFDALDKRLIKLEERVGSIDDRLSSLEEKVDVRLRETRPIWEGILQRLTQIEAALDNFNRQLRALIVDTYQMRVRVEKLEDERATG